MSFVSLKRFLSDSPIYRRLAEEFAFVTYREVREYDFSQRRAS